MSQSWKNNKQNKNYKGLGTNMNQSKKHKDLKVVFVSILIYLFS